MIKGALLRSLLQQGADPLEMQELSQGSPGRDQVHCADRKESVMEPRPDQKKKKNATLLRGSQCWLVESSYLI